MNETDKEMDKGMDKEKKKTENPEAPETDRKDRDGWAENPMDFGFADAEEYGEEELQESDSDPEQTYGRSARAIREFGGAADKMYEDGFYDDDAQQQIPETAEYPYVRWKISPATIQRARAVQEHFGFKSCGQLADDALRFYIGYLVCAPAHEYMSRVTASLIESVLKTRLNAINGVLYKLALETATMSELCENHLGLTEQEIEQVRAKAAGRIKAADGLLDAEGKDLWA